MKIDAVNSAVAPLYTEQQQAAAAKAGATVAAAPNATANTHPDRLVQAVEKLNNSAEAANRQVRFALYNQSRRIIVEVVDKKTDEVVATFPPEQILKMAEAIEQETVKIREEADFKAGEEVK
jgi:uncharacterized FlaG/YvyC family protein